MERTDVLVALVSALALAAIVWSKPLQKLSFWVFVILCVVFYPVGRELFSVLESASGTTGSVAEWIFMWSVDVLFAALVVAVHRGIRSFQSTRADRVCHSGDIDV
ncbi:hypothetical protein [Streptomyces sparsus]